MHVTLHTDLSETSEEQKERLAKQKIGSREGCHPKVLKAQEEAEKRRPKKEESND